MRAIFDNPALLIVLILLVVLLFGAKRLPDAARSIGRSMRIFKSEVKEMKDDDRRPSSEDTAARTSGSPPGQVRQLSWNPTGKYLATGGGDRVTVWDCTPPGPA